MSFVAPPMTQQTIQKGIQTYETSKLPSNCIRGFAVKCKETAGDVGHSFSMACGGLVSVRRCPKSTVLSLCTGFTMMNLPIM